jgi:tRNA G10  N-methylase Trm11
VATVGFDRAAFDVLARAELAACLGRPVLQFEDDDGDEPVAWSTFDATRHDATTAVARSALSHGIYTALGRGGNDVDAAHAVAARTCSASWSLTPIVLGSRARCSRAEAAALVGRAESILAGKFGRCAEPNAGAAAERLVIVYSHATVRILSYAGSGASVGDEGWKYVPCAAAHRKSRLAPKGSLLRQHEEVLRASALPAAKTPMCAELALLMANLAQIHAGSPSVFDPCCGSGSLLVAAAIVGATALQGSDADPACARLLTLFNDGAALPICISTADVGDLVHGRPDVDAVLCDPPYGLTAAEFGPSVVGDVFAFAARRLRVGGRLVVFVPSSRARRTGDAPPNLRRQLSALQRFGRRGFERELLVYEKTAEPAAVVADGRAAREPAAVPKAWSGGGRSDRTRPPRALRRAAAAGVSGRLPAVLAYDAGPGAGSIARP